jgi:hypothetical protein
MAALDRVTPMNRHYFALLIAGLLVFTAGVLSAARSSPLHCDISTWLRPAMGQKLKLPHCDSDDWFTSMSRH